MQWRKAYPESADRLDADGMWHGAAWNFIVWGFYYGVLLVMEKYVWGSEVEWVAVTAQKNLYGSLRVGRLGLLL